MKIAFVDHSYHQKTKSTDFFVREVLAGHQVDRFWDNSWQDRRPLDISPILAGGYDRVIVWQVEQPVERLLRHGATNVVYVPMWDGADLLGIGDWRRLAGARVLSFCHELHRIVGQAGLTSLYAQYWPDPAAFAPVEDFSALRGFFWKRTSAIRWRDIHKLIGSAPFDRLHVHSADDPGEAADDPVAGSTDGRLTVSSWFENADELQALLGRHNVYFAPRAQEGIGFSFIEAMCRGMAVIAADQPTMNEYITDGVNGLLWPLGAPEALDFSDAARLGQKARESAQLGRRRWTEALDRVQAFVLGTEGMAGGGGIGNGAVTHAAPERAAAASGPRVSVAVVTYNAEATLEATLTNILAQTYPNIELVVVDGASSDGTGAIIERYRDRIDALVSEADDGPYFAMNKAARLASGDYILFMNAGDFFASDTGLAEAIESIPAGETPDFIIGHHLYRSEQGDVLRRAADFELTWRRLKDGAIDARWLAGVPCHQATLTRRALLADHGYDTSYRIVADHEFLYRERQNGASVHHSGALIAIYASGGLSWTKRRETYDEWKAVLGRYGNAEAAERIHAELREHLEGEALGKPRYGTVRARSFVSKWQRSLSMRRDMVLVKQTRLFFANWYAEQNPEAKTTRGGPLRHYLRYGVFEYRDPSPFFDTRYYLLMHEDARRSDMLPILFYARHGAARGDATTPWFAQLWTEIAATAPGSGTPLARMIEWFATTPAEEMLQVCQRAGVDVSDAEWARR
ncbi:MAG TPA: glycosyltransferase [Kaistia sp.]|nr:glycosyltransferase [Kaistia sp.]